jgi:hypothetical protein
LKWAESIRAAIVSPKTKDESNGVFHGMLLADCQMPLIATPHITARIDERNGPNAENAWKLSGAFSPSIR